METDLFWMPLLKSRAGEGEDAAYRHRGVASVEEPDLAGETLLLAGMDYSYLLKSGYINWDHQDKRGNPAAIIGEPTDARITELGAIADYPLRPGQSRDTPCFYTEGIFYKGLPEADAVVRLMGALESQSASRRLGYSVQGPPPIKRGKVLVKSLITHLAVTHQPVHTASVAGLAKSLGVADLGLERATPDFAGYLRSLRETPETATEGEALFKSVLGLTPCAAGHHDGERFSGGVTAMADHLVRCDGWDAAGATGYIERIARCLSGA